MFRQRGAPVFKEEVLEAVFHSKKRNSTLCLGCTQLNVIYSQVKTAITLKQQQLTQSQIQTHEINCISHTSHTERDTQNTYSFLNFCSYSFLS